MNKTPRPSNTFDPRNWDGDPDDLVPFQDEVFLSKEICDQTFDTKFEALCVGYHLGFIDAERGAGS
jgi:hypothetical protein